MKKKVFLLGVLLISLFFCSDKVFADAKELTCVYYNGISSYVTMLVQNSNGEMHYFAINTTMDSIKDVDRVDWKETSEFSDNEVEFYFDTDYYDDNVLTDCPKYSNGYQMGDTEVYFYDSNKEWWQFFKEKRYVLNEDLSGEGLPYVVDGESNKKDEITDINEAEWSSKCVYCGMDSDNSCLNLYFNENNILIDNHRKNILSEKATFSIDNIKNAYGFACPDRIYETYYDFYAVYEIPNVTFDAEYHLSNPKTFGTIYNSPQPVFSGGEISSYQVNYLYELKLDKEKSDDEFSYVPGGGSAFTDTDIDNCDDLLGEDLINIINDIMDIVKVIVPILLIVFGILDFTKATFAGNVDEMAKNRKRFINRIIAAVIVYLIPIFVNFLLTLANEVWAYINPSSCIK